ncbi:MAG: ComF family protein [Marinilabilia sp.]
MPSLLRKHISGLSALFFPVVCKGCGETLSHSQNVLCRACESELPRTRYEKMPVNPVVQMFWGRARLEYASALFYYRKGERLQNLIHQLKYKGAKEIGTYLGQLGGKILNEAEIPISPDAIVPVPLHPRKQAIRGYNQTSLIAEGMHSVSGIPVMHDAVIRTKHSGSQTRRGRYERWENVEGIFKVLFPELLRNKHLLILDDVVTTGATLEALCHALDEIPDIKRSVLTIGCAAG